MFMLLAGCASSLENDKSVQQDFHFPVIVDDFPSQSLSSVNVDFKDDGDHAPYYFGGIRDSIHVQMFVGEVSLRTLTRNEMMGVGITSRMVEPKFSDYFRDIYSGSSYLSLETASFLIKYDTTQLINNSGRKAFPVIIQNTSKDTVKISRGRNVNLVTEAKTIDGVWKPIEDYPVIGCANGVGMMILPPGEIVVTSQLIYEGSCPTKLRFKVGNNYSQEFTGLINETQFD